VTVVFDVMMLFMSSSGWFSRWCCYLWRSCSVLVRLVVCLVVLSFVWFVIGWFCWSLGSMVCRGWSWT